jgi:hypothetical protein
VGGGYIIIKVGLILKGWYMVKMRAMQEEKE